MALPLRCIRSWPRSFPVASRPSVRPPLSVITSYSIHYTKLYEWYGNSIKPKDFKKDVGVELRLLTYSYYVYPTAFAFNAAYGLDQFSRIFPTTTNEQKEVTYGKEWRFYFTILFGFDFLVDNIKKMKF